MPIPNQQWQYLLIDEDRNVTGTNNLVVAKEASLSDCFVVVNIASSVILLDQSDGVSGNNIPEQTVYEL